MSIDICPICHRHIDTDNDPEFYGEFENLCEACRAVGNTRFQLEKYPCGCVYHFNSDDGTINHFISPKCRFDNKTHPPIRHYVFYQWDELVGLSIYKAVKALTRNKKT